MIRVAYSRPCLELMGLLRIAHEEVFVTINDRHRGMTDVGLTRITAAHWFSNNRIIFVESRVTKKKAMKDLQAVRFIEAEAAIAIELKSELPAGTLSQEMDMPEILRVVAKSFGHHIVCSPDSFPMALYNGPWDGQTIAQSIFPPSNSMIVFGTFSRERGAADFVWAFDLDRYWEWYRSL